MNILIVESENDQYFIEALAKKISLENKVCKIDTFKHSSFDEQGKALTKQIAEVLPDVSRGLKKIGIILDLDRASPNKRIELINKCLKKALIDSNYIEPAILLSNINEFIEIQKDKFLKIKVACYFTNIDGKGELETVLKEISTKEPKFADCLYEGWQECLKQKGIKIVEPGEEGGDLTTKELVKLWVDFYVRFDTLSKKDRQQAEKNTDWSGVMTGVTKKRGNRESVHLKSARGEEIFNLQHEKLNDLKTFLRLFDNS